MSAFQRQAGIMKELSQMVRDYIFRTVLKKAPKEQIEEMLRSVKCHKAVATFRDDPEFSFYDLLDLVDAAGIDIGVTIRTRDGEEVTFFPAHNFGETGGKNGTPREKRVAKKPYEYTAPAYQHHRGGAHQQQYYQSQQQQGGLYAQDDDWEDYGIGPKLPPSSAAAPGGRPKRDPIPQAAPAGAGRRRTDDKPCG